MSEFWRDRPSEPFTACTDHKRWVLEQLRQLRPDLILASNSITFLDHQEGEPQGAARFARWSAGLSDYLTALARNSPRVVVLGPPPRSGNLQSCVTRVSEPVDCTEDLPVEWQGLRTAEQSAAAHVRARYIDPEPWFCAADRCPAVVGSTPVYTDGRHLTAAYSKRLAPQLAAALVG